MGMVFFKVDSTLGEEKSSLAEREKDIVVVKGMTSDGHFPQSTQTGR